MADYITDLTHLFKIGQKIIYKNNDFDAIKQNIPCVVKEVFSDHIIVTDTETNTDLWVEEGFNMDCVVLKEKFILNKKYLDAIRGFEEGYRFSLEERLVNGDSDYLDCRTAEDVIKELEKFVADEDFLAEDYECLAVLIYEADIPEEDNWGERVAEYYFI